MLVVDEVHAGGVAQRAGGSGGRRASLRRPPRSMASSSGTPAEVAGDPEQLRRDLRRRQDRRPTTPAATALRGMPSYRAVSSCAKVSPPASLIAFKPRVPSVPVPDRITPIA